jgi:transcriptional regulator with XRE-family HTH domain
MRSTRYHPAQQAPGAGHDRDFPVTTRLGFLDCEPPDPAHATIIETPPCDVFARVLGDELRRARGRLGWTRKQLQSRLRSELSLQTLGTYETGTRRCSVARLVELCEALGVLAHELLARVYERTENLDSAGRFVLDLDRVVHDRGSDLVPLRRWAHERLEQVGYDQPSAVPLGMSALEDMAQLCDVTTNELIWRLRELGGRETTIASAE